MSDEDQYSKPPAGAWDSHTHVIDDRFPLDQNRTYTPKQATLKDQDAYRARVGLDHACIVAVSVYGTDNRSLLAALETQDNGRGVVTVDRSVSDEELDRMHAVGVRGIRFNFHTTNTRVDQSQFSSLLYQYADKIRRLNWVIQMFITLDQIALIAADIPKLGVDVVFDHLGAPRSTIAPQEQPGYAELMSLLRSKHAYVKLSGIYRFDGELMPGLDTYVREMLRDAKTQVVWGSDWPHVGGPECNREEGDRLKTQEYRNIDVPAFICRCKDWCGGDEETLRLIFVDNPRRLWRYP